jgi:hypothetical protein
VTAPWSVELDEYILSSVLNNSIERGTNEHGKWALFSWFNLTLKMGLEFISLEVFNKGLDSVNSEFVKITTVNELSHFFTGAKETESWGLRGINTNKLGKTLLNTLFSA